MSATTPDDDLPADPVLRMLGYRGDPMIYRQRLDRMRELARDGDGPLAAMHRVLRRAGYRPAGKHA